jgi:hypothetical protein
MSAFPMTRDVLKLFAVAPKYTISPENASYSHFLQNRIHGIVINILNKSITGNTEHIEQVMHVEYVSDIVAGLNFALPGSTVTTEVDGKLTKLTINWS